MTWIEGAHQDNSWCISNILCYIETCVRRHLTIAYAISMDENFYSHLINCILNDDNILFYWCMAGMDKSDEDN